MHKKAMAKDRCKKIMEAGLELFLKNGYSDTNISEIVKISGGSLSTFYKYFNNKDDFFKTIVLSGVEKNFNFLKDEINFNLPPEEFLYKFSIIFLSSLLLNTNSMDFLRLIKNESIRFSSQIGQIFYEYGIKSVNEILISYFQKHKDKINIPSQDYEFAANAFRAILFEPYRIYIFNKQKVIYSKNDIEKQAKIATQIFMFGIQKTD